MQTTGQREFGKNNNRIVISMGGLGRVLFQNEKIRGIWGEKGRLDVS
jgi:hypothetical protein